MDQLLSLGLPTSDPLAPGPEASDAITRAPSATMPKPGRLWRPKRVVATKSAMEWAHGRAILERAAALGLTIVELGNDRLGSALPDDPRRAYAEAKATMALVVASPRGGGCSQSRRRRTGGSIWRKDALRIAPIAIWRGR